MKRLIELLLICFTLIWIGKLGFNYVNKEVEILTTHDVVCEAYNYTKSSNGIVKFYTTEDEMKDLLTVKAHDGTIYNLTSFPAYKCRDVNPNNNTDDKLEYVTYDYQHLDTIRKLGEKFGTGSKPPPPMPYPPPNNDEPVIINNTNTNSSKSSKSVVKHEKDNKKASRK